MTVLPADVAANLRQENARLQAELRAARDRQVATADILRAIASTSGNAEQALQQIAETTARLFDAQSVRIRIAENGEWVRTITVGESAERVNAEVSATQGRIGGKNLSSTVVLEDRQVHIPDLDNVDPGMADWPGVGPARAAGARTTAGTPLRREGKAIGVLILYRHRLAPFTSDELALLQSFADQAVIAIENARLFNETKEALERQTATADILKVIASSPSDVQPVFEAIAASSNRLIGGHSTAVLRFIGDDLHLAAFTPTNPAADETLKASFPRPLAEFPPFMLVRDGQAVEFADTESEDVPPLNRDLARMRGYRSMLFTPLMNGVTPIGLISVTRKEPGKFAPHHAQLVRTFADQAVIAIENVRLFDEVQARTSDLSEALQQQTATADVLKVISRSAFDIQTVFETLIQSAALLCHADRAAILRLSDNRFQLVATHGFPPEFQELMFARGLDLDRGSAVGRAALERRVVQIPDILADPEFTVVESQRRGGFRTVLAVPLLREGSPIGGLFLTRGVVAPFTQQQIDLVTTFADQAVIAIENVRLFDEVQAKTRDLTEALTYQTGSSNILKVIASSPTNVAPVLRAIADSACELCEAHDAIVFLREGDHLRYRAHHGPIPFGFEKLPAGDDPIAFGTEKLPINRDWITGRSVVDQVPVHVRDVLSTEGADFPEAQRLSRREGTRTLLSVPLLREGESIGAIVLRRTEVHPFSDKQIALLQTFADQAVIAIGNVRLFDEVQARTSDLGEALQQQTATSEVLKVISRSAFDLQTVLDTLVTSASTLCSADQGMLLLMEAGVLKPLSYFGPHPEKFEFRKSIATAPHRGNLSGRAVLDGQTAHVADVLTDPDFTNNPWQQLTGFRAMLAVPLMRKGEPIGAMALSRTMPGLFADRQIDLVTTFADQAVIAIENVRLFDEVQAKTRDLTEALTYQTGSSNILKVIASSPTDVGPVLKAIVESACELCETDDAVVYLREGDELCYAARHGSIPAGLQRSPISRNFVAGRSLLDKAAIHLRDVLSAEGAEFPQAQEMSRRNGIRTLLSMPLLREDEGIGTIVLRRTEVRPFSHKQIALLQTFADQAVIAIGNVRLFDEVQARTRELSESLDELRTAQDRLIQTEKLASLGQLTAGIAHEIKNPLNFVNNFAALSAELTDELNEVLKPAPLMDTVREEVDELTRLLKDNLEKVVQHGKRADSIVKNMLLHSREGSGDHRPADINALLDESLNLAYHGARAEKPQFNVTLQRDFDESAGSIEVFPQEITRVFLNLISNGFYAVTKRKMENGNPGFEPVLVATTRDRGDTVEIRIRDNGTGIPSEVKEKMFNPFFTTKPAGEGTGLGLSMSHDIIVKQHGGRIEVATEPGQFTEFTIVLPRTSHSADRNRGQT